MVSQSYSEGIFLCKIQKRRIALTGFKAAIEVNIDIILRISPKEAFDQNH